MLDSLTNVWTHERQKCKPWDDGRGNPQWYEPKFDGWRLTLFKQDDDTLGVCAFGRKVEPHLELSHYLDELPWYKRFLEVAPGHSSWDGEIVAPKGARSDVITLLKTSPASLIWRPFAIPFWNGNDNISMADYPYLTEDVLGWPRVETYPYHGQTAAYLLDTARKHGWEGVVLKEYPYANWWKLKLEHTIDCIVTGVKRGNELGKYSDHVGALLVGLRAKNNLIVEVASVSGMNEEVRFALTPLDIGRVCEVKYQNVGAGGRLVHPRFIRWRDDKPAEECLMSQIGESNETGTETGKDRS